MKTLFFKLFITQLFLLISINGFCRGDQNRGKKIFQRQGCMSCHGSQSIQGPRLQNLYGSLVKLNSGKVIKADEIYLRDSIVKPQKHIVHGFEGIMPSYKGMIKKQDLDDLIEYLKHLKSSDL